MKRQPVYIVMGLWTLICLASCSTTRNLAEGEQLYTGRKGIQVENHPGTSAGNAVMAEIDAALAKPPNNALFGSSSLRTPLPFGLWFYNAYVNRSEKGLGKWIFNTFAAKPVYISTVNPELRAKVAANLLRDHGFFNGTAGYEVITSPKNPRKAKILYRVDMKNPYLLDTIMYGRFAPEIGELFSRSQQMTLLRKGDQFNVPNLEAERQRLSTLLRNRGYYYFRPEYIGYRADTTRVSGLVDLQIIPKPGLPAEARRKYYIGDISVHMYGVHGQTPNDSVEYEGVTLHYYNKLSVRPKVLLKRFRFREGQLYSQIRTNRTHERFSELGVFRYSEIRFTPRDTVAGNDTLDVAVRTTLDLPYDSELELNVATKSNDYAGPGIAYGVTRRNVFRGGETFSVRVKGSYEWQTKSSGGSGAKVNSYELGLTASLAFPRLLFPRLGKEEYDFPATTTFSLNADQLNRAGYFRMLSFGGDATYVLQPTRVSKHAVTPFRLTFNTLQSRTATFDSIIALRPVLERSMQDQFIPAANYTYTYDDTPVRRRKNRFWWQASFTSAGNLTSGVAALFGKKFGDEKIWLGARMAQFLKMTHEVRRTWVLDRNQSIATRLMGGIIYAYGADKIPPYNEQFYVGGANSIRAFTVRSIGPGRYQPDPDRQYSYLDQTGDIRLEANLEYRFRLIENLHGAVFLDAGNIWLLRDDPADNEIRRVGGKFSLKDLPKDIALGTGFGLRYDLSYLVIRLDCGIGLHLPYETSRGGYYNIPAFKDGLGIHLAVGYPF